MSRSFATRWEKLRQGIAAFKRNIVQPEDLIPRFMLFFAIVILSVIVLGHKAFTVHVTDTEDAEKKFAEISYIHNRLPFSRARILDRNGKLLAVNGETYVIKMDLRNYFNELVMRDSQMRKALENDIGGSTKAYLKAAKAFVKSRNEDAKIPFDPRDIMNVDSEGYWEMLARTFDLDGTAITRLRNNPNSFFIRMERERYAEEMAKWRAFAKEAKLDYNTLMDRIYQAPRRMDLTLATKKDEAFSDFVGELGIRFLKAYKEQQRFYLRGEELASLIGFTGVNEGKENGREGLEMYYDSLLIGENGREKFRKDKKNRLIRFSEYEAPVNRPDMRLSIDENLQSVAYAAVKKAVIDNKADAGTAVLMDIQTGEVLAMANFTLSKKDVKYLQGLTNDTASAAYQNAVSKHTFEVFNPNNRSTYKTGLNSNRAIHYTFEPGSTVKPFTVLTALQQKLVTVDSVLDTRPFKADNLTVRDTALYPSLSLTGVIQKSSNVGVAQLALRMSSETLPETYRKLGFGERAGLKMNEAAGSIDPRESKSRPWAKSERATIAYGYGIAVTPLQLASAYATLGSYGIRRPVSILKTEPPVLGERVLSEKYSREVIKMMETVAQEGGTAVRAKVEGYRVAVKTGTAKKREGKQYVERYLAFTAGIAPASNPRFSLVVLVDEPRTQSVHGGAVAGPLFSRIMGYALKTYNIKPDNLE